MTEEELARQSALGHLTTLPGWAIVKEIVESHARHQRVNFGEPHVALRQAYQAGRIEGEQDLLKLVEAAANRTRPQSHHGE